MCWRQWPECDSSNTETCAGASAITINATASNNPSHGHQWLVNPWWEQSSSFLPTFKCKTCKSTTAVTLSYNQTCFDFLSPWQHVSAIPKGRWMPAAVNWGASVHAKLTSWDAAVTPALQAATASASTAAMVSTWQPAPVPVPVSGSSCIPQLFRALNPWLCRKQHKKCFHE